MRLWPKIELPATSRDGARAVIEARLRSGDVNFEGSAPATPEELEYVRAAAVRVQITLLQLGFPEHAERVKKRVEDGKVRSFRTLKMRNAEGKVQTVSADGGYHMDGHLYMRKGQFRGEQTLPVHELFHAASTVPPAESATLVTRAEGAYARAISGVEISAELPEFDKDADLYPRFVALNEGITETLTGLSLGLEARPFQGYTPFRYLFQILMRAVTASHQKTNPDYTVKEAFQVFMSDYLNNTSQFVAEVEKVLGGGAAQELARLEPSLVPTKNPHSSYELMEKLLARVQSACPNLAVLPVRQVANAESRVNRALFDLDQELREALGDNFKLFR